MAKGRRLFRSFCLSLPVAIAPLAVAAPARGDDAANTATARALGIEGVTLAEAGKCREAIEKLERAESLHHAPTTATRLGECEIDTGKLVSGTERLQRVVREPLPPNAHPAFVAAIARAQKALDKTLPRISTLRISVKAPRGTKFAVVIDDEPAPSAIVDSNRWIDPGVHKIQVAAKGFLSSSTTASLDEGQTKSVFLELVPDPSMPPKGRAPEAGAASSGEATTERNAASKVPAFVAFGVGVLGLGVGTFAAVTVARKSSALSSSCDANKVCPTDRQPDITAAKEWATVSTVGFIAGGAGVATGLLLLLASGSPASTPRTGLHVRPSMGAASVGLDGVF